MAPRSRTTWRSPCINPPANIPREKIELAGMPGRPNAGSNEASTFSKAPILPLVLPSAKDLFIKFMKVFMNPIQAQTLAESWKRSLKAKTSKTYWGKSNMECYYFCQQCEDYFAIFGATGTNRTLFAVSFLCGSISIRWAQHKCRHKSATPITWPEFKAFFRKDLGSSQAFIDSISNKF